MGVTCDEYIILTAYSKKPLKKIRQYAKRIFDKSDDLKAFKNCIGKIGGGMNGHYSLVIVPTGWNGGYGVYEVIDKIKSKIEKFNFKAEQFNVKNGKKIEKGLVGRKSPLYWDVLAFTDWGITFASHREDDEGCDPELKWANNCRSFITPKSGHNDLNKEQFEEVIRCISEIKGKKQIADKLKAQYREKFARDFK